MTAAPSFIKSLQPSLKLSPILPGTTITSLFCSSAASTVISEPLFFLASTTITTSDKPLIILFLTGNCPACGAVPTGYSDTIQPFSFICVKSSIFCLG